ncbi:hypothetical protein HpBGD103_14590 [Helicobacter pylori]
MAVPYTPLTLPHKRQGEIREVHVPCKKKKTEVESTCIDADENTADNETYAAT